MMGDRFGAWRDERMLRGCEMNSVFLSWEGIVNGCGLDWCREALTGIIQISMPSFSMQCKGSQVEGEFNVHLVIIQIDGLAAHVFSPGIGFSQHDTVNSEYRDISTSRVYKIYPAHI